MSDREAAAASEPLQPLPEANLYAHELLSNGGGIWLACASESIVRQAHDPGETGEEIRALFTAEQMREYVLADRRAALSSAPAPDAAMELLKKLLAHKDTEARLKHLHEMGHGTDYDQHRKAFAESWDRARSLIAANKERTARE